MRTQIPQRRLTELRAHEMAQQGRFVDPAMLHRCSRVLDVRGEQWAASVLGHDITRRSLAVPSRPFLHAGQEYTLVAADAEEDKITLAALAVR